MGGFAVRLLCSKVWMILDELLSPSSQSYSACLLASRPSLDKDFSSSTRLSLLGLSTLVSLASVGRRVLLRCQSLELQCVDAVVLGHLVAEQGVHHAVARGPGLGAELGRRDDQPEVRLLGRAVSHGGVVRVLVRVVVDIKARGRQRGG